MAMWLSIIGIIISIFIGWKFKFNTGVIAMVFAFLIGTLCQFPQVNKAGEAIMAPLTVNAIVQMFPTMIVFYLIAIALFFGYATETGTMNILGQKLLYILGGNAKLVPLVIAIVAAIVGGLGAGSSTPIIVGPFCFIMAIAAGVSPLLTAMAIGLGNLIGSGNPYNGYGGVIGKNLVIANGVPDDVAMTVANFCWLNSVLVMIVILVVFYIGCKGYKGTNVKMEKPPAFTAQQRQMLAIVLVAFFFMIVPALLNTWVKGVPFIETFARVCQPQTVMVIGAVLCAFLRMADERKVIRTCPWSTIVMIIGVYMLIQVANKAGLADAIAVALSSTIPPIFVPVAMIAFGGFLSFFSSSTSVVMPLLYPLVPGLSSGLGINPVTLYSCAYWSGLTTAMSPFSTGGAVVIAACPDEAVKEKLPNAQILGVIIMISITLVFVFLGGFNLFTVAGL